MCAESEIILSEIVKTKEKNPLVSVVIPVYNSANFLAEAMDSLVNQTLKDIEIICVYDKSDDNSLEILKSYAQKDNRVRIIENEEKRGIGFALNLGLDAANGKYIARMDADDISVLSRLQVQYEYMEKNPDIDICGSFIKKFGASSRIVRVPQKHKQIKTKMMFSCCVMHPTAIFRKAALEKHNVRYNEEYRICEDYDLWARCMEYCKFHNIPKVLLYYRVHNENTSNTHKDSVMELTLDITKRQFEKYFGSNISVEDIESFLNNESFDTQKIYALYKFMLDNAAAQNLDRTIFKRFLTKKVIKKLRNCFKKDKTLFSLLQMFRYNLFSALFYTLTHFYRIKRLK